MSVIERHFALHSGLRVAARIHHAGAPTRVLAVHGWLDNAASFDALASWLPDCELVAIDLVGHGRSDHRPSGSWYHTVDYLDELVEILDQLDGGCSVWLGHSLGGGLLSMLAAALPERVEQLVLIESLGLLSGDAARAAEQLRRALDDRAAFRAGKTLRVFRDLENAVTVRRAAGDLTEAAAQALVERGLRETDGGWVWSSDPRLMLATPLRTDETHFRALLAAIACQTLVILAEPPLPFMPAVLREARLSCMNHSTIERIAGSHHVHMDRPDAVSPAIATFLAAGPK